MRGSVPLQLTGATLVLLPLEGLLVWAAHAHPSQLRWLADRDQTYALSGILDWTDGHGTLAAGLAALWLVLQAAAVLLGAVYCCWPGGRRYKHPWDRYWVEGDEGRDPLLPPRPAGEADAAGGYHTPPSRFGTPHSSPGARLPPVLVIEQPSAPSAPMAYPIL
ncbi:expressed protein [Chlorella variabilis]|uniref:Expressed protein n=1 Tax=Chlorella variabilis TaxID=554065 RepID=E1ZR48_CHLVA|nr:expressed protein [Chlorella variabilis]EFN51667.1 expressed protein [Chlorella variabilis]|eukprot:XP_005843769.1 expressed protein [Chlorella variabilis]